MALSGLDIYKKLPQTNCGDCGVPTCLAFAMKLAQGQASLDQCPHASEETKAALAEAQAPPILGVTIGGGDKALKVGEELVLFRHEKTFYNPTGIAILVDDSMDDSQVDTNLKQIKENQFERVGQLLKADLVAVKSESGDAKKFADLAKKAKESTGLPLILVSDKPDMIKAGLDVVKDDKPLICAANEGNSEAMANTAKEASCPLVVKSDDGLDKLAELTEKIKAIGVPDLVIDSGARKTSEVLKDQVMIRRAALEKKYRPLGYPTITFPCEETNDEYLEAMLAGIYLTKYAGIVVLKSLDSWKAMPLLVLRQNVFTDPQQPMQVEEKIYPIGEPKEDSPVLVTTNFSLTYFTVSNEVEASKVPAWLCVMDVEGLSVLTAWGAGKFVPDKIAQFVQKVEIAGKVNHKKITIPGYIAQISGELEDELSDWKVEIGPREAGDIPQYLKAWSA